MGWREYWEGDSAVYVSERHKSAHYAHLADDILEVAQGLGKPLSEMSILDFGCGEALSAGRIAQRVAKLTLNDGSAKVRGQLHTRFGQLPNVIIAAPEDLAGPSNGAALPDADRQHDLVVVNSVLQYVEPEAAGPLLQSLGRTLRHDGRMLIADVLPPNLSAVTDAWQLLSFAGRDGFLIAAVLGLARTAVSDYAKIRAQIGLTRYAAADFERLAAAHGLVAVPLPRNIGHNPHRLAYLLHRARTRT